MKKILRFYLSNTDTIRHECAPEQRHNTQALFQKRLPGAIVGHEVL